MNRLFQVGLVILALVSMGKLYTHERLKTPIELFQNQRESFVEVINPIRGIQGSGFVVNYRNKEYIVTAGHACLNETTMIVQLDSEPTKPISVPVLKNSSDYDICILDIVPNAKGLTFRNRTPDEVIHHDKVFTIGYDFEQHFLTIKEGFITGLVENMKSSMEGMIAPSECVGKKYELVVDVVEILPGFFAPKPVCYGVDALVINHNIPTFPGESGGVVLTETGLVEGVTVSAYHEAPNNGIYLPESNIRETLDLLP